MGGSPGADFISWELLAGQMALTGGPVKGVDTEGKTSQELEESVQKGKYEFKESVTFKKYVEVFLR